MKALLVGLFLMNLLTFEQSAFAKNDNLKNAAQLTEENFDRILFASKATNEFIVRTKSDKGFEILLCSQSPTLENSCEKLSSYVIPPSESVALAINEEFEKNLNTYIKDNFKEKNVSGQIGLAVGLSAVFGGFNFVRIITAGNVAGTGISRPAYPNFSSFVKGTAKKVGGGTLFLGGVLGYLAYISSNQYNENSRSLNEEIQVALEQSAHAMEENLTEVSANLTEEEKHSVSKLAFSAIKYSLALTLSGEILINPLDGTVVIVTK